MANEFKIKNGLFVSGSAEITNNLTVNGRLTAEEYHVSFVSSSVLYESGSTKFGDSSDDTHLFTGSIKISGSIDLNGQTLGTGKLDETTFESFTASYLEVSSSLDERIGDLESFSSSLDNTFVSETEFGSHTSSINGRVDDLETESGSIRGDFNSFTSSYTDVSTSIDSRLDTLETLSGSFTGSFSGSFTGDGTNLYNIPASGVTGLNLTQIADGSVTASVSNANGLRVNSKTEITGSLIITDGITGSIDYSNITNKPTLVSGSEQINITETTGYSTFSSSVSTSIGELSSSVATTTNDLDDRLDDVETSTGSLNSFTSSINTTIKDKLNTEGVISGSVQVNLPDVTGFSEFSSSISSSVTTIFIDNFDQDNRLDEIETSTGSLNSFTSSINTTIKDKLNTEGVISSSAQVNLPDVTGYSTFSSSISSSIGLLSSSIAVTDLDQSDRLTTIEGRYATTGSNTFVGQEIISGSITLSPSIITIDDNISGSHIYSKGDEGIYFTQNYNGLSSETELRWLEGNLYTGLLYGGVISATNGGTTFNISAGKGIIVNLNATTTSSPQPTIIEVEWDAFTGQTITNIGTAIQTFLGIDSSGEIIQQVTPFTSAQFNNSISLGTVLHQNSTTVNGSTNYPNVAYGYKQRTYDFVKAFGPLKLSGLELFASGSSTGSLIVSTGTAYAEGRNYSVDPNNPSYITDSGTNVSKIFRYHQVSGTTFVQDTNGGSGYASIDTLQYNNSGTLTTVPDNEWTTQRVFWFPNSATKAILVYYGNKTYTTSAEAIANLPYEAFTEVANTQQNAVYLGSLVVKKGADFTNTSTYQILPGGLFRNLGGTGGGGTTVTNRLSDLSDVDVTTATNGQLFVYNASSDKWYGSSNVTASLFGNASTSTKLQSVRTINGTSFDGTQDIVIPDLVSGSSQVSFNGITDKPTLVSGSSQITYGSLSGIPSGIISGSLQLPSGIVSGSSQVLNGSGVWSGSAQLPSGVVSGSSQITFGSITGIPSGLVSGSSQVLDGTTIHSGSFFNGVTVVSGSGQISFNGITDKPTLVSGSSQITYGSLTGIPSGIISGSAQLPSGVVSGSSQVLAGTTIHSGSFFNGISVVSGSAQIAFGGITGVPSGLVSGSSQITGIGNSQLTNSSFYIGTTSISLGRSSASQTLTGVSIDGNSATVTNGVYTTGDQSIGGSKVFTGVLQGRKNQTANDYTTAAIWTESYGNTGTGIAFHINGIVGKYLEMRTNGTLYWENNTVWTSGTLTNLNQLTNGPGYITGVTNISGNAGTVTNGVYTTGDQTIGGTKTFNGTHLAIENSSGTWKYIRYRSGSTTLWDVGTNENDDGTSYQIRPNGGSTNRMTLSLSGAMVTNFTGADQGLTINKVSGGSGQWNYIGFSYQGTRKAYFGTDSSGYAVVGSDVGLISLQTATQISGHLTPTSNNAYNLGSATLGWANVYTNDLHLSNMNKPGGNDIDGTSGTWTIQEGAENLYIINNRNNKKFKISLEEIL